LENIKHTDFAFENKNIITNSQSNIGNIIEYDFVVDTNTQNLLCQNVMNMIQEIKKQKDQFEDKENNVDSFLGK